MRLFKKRKKFKKKELLFFKIDKNSFLFVSFLLYTSNNKLNK